jgi:uncharacterized protein
MNKKVRILSLDGGGMRGIIPATVLTYVENQLIKRTGNPNTRLADFFDMIVGTSTGAILGSFYLMPYSNGIRNGQNSEPSSKYPASKALEFYTIEGRRIFNDSRKHNWFGIRQIFNAVRFSPENIESIFLREFGDMKLHQLIKPCIITTYDIHNQRAFFFNSREDVNKPREFYLRDVVRSTSAAPTYFPPAIIRNIKTGQRMVNIDGGVFANNPAMCAYSEARTTVFEQASYPSAKDMLIMSIGTGGGKIELPKDVFTSGNWGAINWATSIPDIMMNGGSDTVDYHLKRIFSTLEGENKKNYLRIDVPQDKRRYKSDMADASDDNVKALIKAGNETLNSALLPLGEQHTLDKFIDLLWENAPVEIAV